MSRSENIDGNILSSFMTLSPSSSVKSPDGRYIRLNFIGSGSYKEVYSALDEVRGVEVAWCEMTCTLGNDLCAKQEVALLRCMHHPNLLPCYASWEDTVSRRLIFITELMSGGTLTDLYRRLPDGRLCPLAIVRYARQTLLALQYLHQNKIIHRDVKCSNIFVNSQKGEVRLGDLGLCMVNNSRMSAPGVAGTPEYMAPEMYNRHYDTAVDMWAFGLCILEMATGRPPYYDCEHIGQIHRRVSLGVLPHIGEIADAELRRVVSMCVQPVPARRVTADELLRDPLFNDPRRETDDNDNSDNNISGNNSFVRRGRSHAATPLPMPAAAAHGSGGKADEETDDNALGLTSVLSVSDVAQGTFNGEMNDMLMTSVAASLPDIMSNSQCLRGDAEQDEPHSYSFLLFSSVRLHVSSRRGFLE